MANCPRLWAAAPATLSPSKLNREWKFSDLLKYNNIAITQVAVIAPEKLKKKAILNKVPLNKEPNTVRIKAIVNAVLKSKSTKARRVTILANPSLTPGMGKGMGIRASNRCRTIARATRTAIVVSFLVEIKIFPLP